ncbi:hypothetical protein HYX08_01375 [Candidatus Woesearchaeota archaeon]|nr:hypothetical protein [Candidatus Woesearchaeota archaeon]
MALVIFAATWFNNILRQTIGIDSLLSALALILVILMIGKFFPRNIFLIMLTAIALLRILVDKSVYDFATWRNFLLFMAIIMVTRYLLILLSQSFVKNVSFDALKPGDQPAEIIIKSGGVYKKKKADILALHKKLAGIIFQPKPPGLSEEDIQKIKESAKHFAFKELKIRETISFAPFLFTGALIQIILNDNLISYLVNTLF